MSLNEFWRTLEDLPAAAFVNLIPETLTSNLSKVSPNKLLDHMVVNEPTRIPRSQINDVYKMRALLG